MTTTQLVICDFDWSVIDQDTDRWVAEVLSVETRRKMEDLDGKQLWTEVVANSLVDLHAAGITRAQIEHTLSIIPFHPAMVRALKGLKAAPNPSTTLFCLSNSNSVYISTVLKAHSLEKIFDEIVTNPAHWDESGVLRVKRRVDPAGPQHNCKIGCKANMCKGEELDSFLQRHGTTFHRMVYLGDGNNDFCPLLHLRRQDVALVRKGRGLEHRVIHEGPAAGLVCQVKYWEGAWEVEELFPEL